MDELDYTQTLFAPGIIVGTLFSCIMLRDTRDQLVPH